MKKLKILLIVGLVLALALPVYARIVKVPQITLTVAADGTSDSDTLNPINGRVTNMVLVIPDWTNTVTATLTITDADSADIFTEASLAQDSTHIFDQLWDKIPISGAYTVTVTLSGVPGAGGGDCTFSMTYEEG